MTYHGLIVIPTDVPSSKLPWSIDPVEVLSRWPKNQPVLLLHSGRYHPQWATYSLLATPAGIYRFTPRRLRPSSASGDAAKPTFPAGLSNWMGPDDLFSLPAWTHRPFEDLQRLLHASAGRGIWIGYFSYEIGHWIEHLPQQEKKADRLWPVMEWAFCPGWAVYDLSSCSWHSHGRWIPPATLTESLLPAVSTPHGFHAESLGASFTRAGYTQTVRQAMESISRGDIYQVNLAQRLSCSFAGNPRRLFTQLMQVSPAWYGAYLEFPGKLSASNFSSFGLASTNDSSFEYNRVLTSISPELFLSLDPSGKVITRPIKGTRPAHLSPDQLQHSDKDIAELNMIVDLLRNDLGRVCEYGSIHVEQARTIESHPTVHHGVATICGKLHPAKTITQLLHATLPGGSITGAPKIRAMQIIDQLEPVPRGPYCGSIGWLTHDACALNVAIRTLTLTPCVPAHVSPALHLPLSVAPAFSSSSPADHSLPSSLFPSQHLSVEKIPPTHILDFSVGAGIVADSEPEKEYQETLDKAAAVQAALGLPANMADTRK